MKRYPIDHNLSAYKTKVQFGANNRQATVSIRSNPLYVVCMYFKYIVPCIVFSLSLLTYESFAQEAPTPDETISSLTQNSALSIDSCKHQLENFCSHSVLDNVHINPLVDLCMLYEADREVIHSQFGWKKWDLVLINDAESSVTNNLLHDFTPFKIGKYPVTAVAYATFLSVVAPYEDPHQLFDPRMETDPKVASIKRTFNTEKNRYEYKALKGREDVPITYVNLDCARRFCNWLHNGYPNLEELKGRNPDEITEQGTYDFKENETVVINPNGLYFLPSKEQWDHAAYYVHESYFCDDDDMCDHNSSFALKDHFSYLLDYPTSHDGHPPLNRLGCTGDANYAHRENVYIFNLPGDVNNYYQNQACDFRLTPVGSFGEGNHSLCDMGGNVDEWIETPFPNNSLLSHIIQGGSWASPREALHRNTKTRTLPISERNNTTGFRIAGRATPLSPIAAPQTMSEAMIHHLEGTNARNVDWLDNAILFQPVLGPLASLGELSIAFVGHEALEMASMSAADLLIQRLGQEEEGAVSATWRYWRVMGLPTGFYLGGSIAAGTTATTLEISVHALVDTLVALMIDRLGYEGARALAERWGLGPLIEFYETIDGGAEYLITALTYRLRRCVPCLYPLENPLE